MTVPHGGAAAIFRDFETGSSGPLHKPLKGDLRDWGAYIEAIVAVMDGLSPSANGVSLIEAANYAAMRTLLGLGTAALKATTGSLSGSANLPTDLAVQNYVTAAIAAISASPIQYSGSIATTSGTQIDFTGIPNWVSRVTVLFNAVSFAGTAYPVVQIGDSGGIEASGYAAYGSVMRNSSSATVASSTEFPIYDSAKSAGSELSGRMTISKISGTTWVADGVFGDDDGGHSLYNMAGSKTLTGTLDRLRITSSTWATSPDTFDNGRINLQFE